MSIKKLTNDVETYNSFLEYLDTLIEKEQRVLEQQTDTVLLYKAQGALALLRRLKKLRETVNGQHS